MNTLPEKISHPKLGEKWIGGADTADLSGLTRQPGPIIVGDKTFLLKVGIFFTCLALATSLYLFWNIGTFLPTLILLSMVISGLGVFIYRLQQAAHVLRIDDQGIDDRTQSFGGGFTPWCGIISFKTVHADGRQMIGITLSDDTREKRDFFSKTLMDEQRRTLDCDIVLPPELFGSLPADTYSQMLNEFLEDPSKRAELAEPK